VSPGPPYAPAPASAYSACSPTVTPPQRLHPPPATKFRQLEPIRLAQPDLWPLHARSPQPPAPPPPTTSQQQPDRTGPQASTTPYTPPASTNTVVCAARCCDPTPPPGRALNRSATISSPASPKPNRAAGTARPKD